MEQIVSAVMDAVHRAGLVEVEVSARHVHLSQADVEVLFGPGARLEPKRPLSQPGQFLSEQRVTLVGPKGRKERVAVLGPARKATQVERLMRERGLSPAEAAREALRQDRERARLYGLHTGAKWGEVGRYDLTVDSGPLGVSGTVELLSQFIALKTMRRRSKEAAHAGTTD